MNLPEVSLIHISKETHWHHWKISKEKLVRGLYVPEPILTNLSHSGVSTLNDYYISHQNLKRLHLNLF